MIRHSVDIIVKHSKGIVLIKRKNPPFGWALPGGFVEEDESLEQAATREAKEETNLDIDLERQFHTYSDPGRDIRGRTITTVFIAIAKGKLKAGDDASEAEVFSTKDIPELVFDHNKIIKDYFLNSV